MGEDEEERARPRPLADLPTLGLLALMYALLVGSFVGVVGGWLPWPAGMAASFVAIHLSFTIWHEAAHGNAAKDRWANNVIGVLGMFPYFAPYFHTRYLHLKHHARLNAPDDPNRLHVDYPPGELVKRYAKELSYYGRALGSTPIRVAEKVCDLVVLALTLGVLAAATLAGLWLEIVLLWLVPFVAAKLVQDWYVNRLPHVGLPADRLRGTRCVRLRWLTPVVLCHNYHAVHHLWPQHPWHRYPAVFARRYYQLLGNGVPVETSLRPAGATALESRTPPGGGVR